MIEIIASYRSFEVKVFRSEMELAIRELRSIINEPVKNMNSY